MGWDANIVSTEFKGKLPLQSFNNLQAAIKERCQGAGISVPSIFNSDMAKMVDMQPSNWFSLFQSTMTTLISAYVNHTDHGGDWTGQISIPAWTQATILTAIGDGSRLAAPSSRKCAAWCFQQYKMLNMMRWKLGSYTEALMKHKHANPYGHGTTPEEAFLNAKIQFDAYDWSDSGSQFEKQFFGQTGSYCTESYNSYIYANKIPIICDPIGSLKYSADFYILPTKSFLSQFPSVIASYGWSSVSVGILIKDYSISEITASQTVYTPVMTPIVALYESNFWKSGNTPGIFYAVLKFDGANGFTYKSW